MQWSVFRAVEDCMLELVHQYGEDYWNKLQAARDLICKCYSQELLNTECATLLPFCHEDLRWAYAHLYITPHTHMVKDILTLFWMEDGLFQQWFNRQRRQPVRICCVGGGPGSDLLGFALFLHNCNLDTHVAQADVLDQWPQWKDTFLSLVRRLNCQHLLPSDDDAVKYWNFQFHENWDSNKNLHSIEDADIVMMVKFVSAVAATKDDCERKLTVLLQKMKDGALLFVMDNSGGGSTNIVCRAASNAGFHELTKREHVELSLPKYEGMYISSSTLRLAKISLQKTWKISAFLWQKEDVQFKENIHPYPPQHCIDKPYISPQHSNANWDSYSNLHYSSHINYQYPCRNDDFLQHTYEDPVFTSPNYNIFDTYSHQNWLPPPDPTPAASNYNVLELKSHKRQAYLNASPYSQQNWNFKPYAPIKTDNHCNSQFQRTQYEAEKENDKCQQKMPSRTTMRSHPYQRPAKTIQNNIYEKHARPTGPYNRAKSTTSSTRFRLRM